MDCKKAQSLVIPFINNELKEEELEDFLTHIKDCKECYEELEIHFTIHYALQKLDEDETVSFNVPKMLKEHLKSARNRVIRRKALHYVGRCVMAVAELFLALAIWAQMDMLPNGKIEDTGLYRLLERAPEETESESDGSGLATEAASAETETGTAAETDARTEANTEKKTEVIHE